MKRSGMPWVKIFPDPLLHVLTEHSAAAQLVYVLTLLLIYENEGPIKRDDKAMANRAHLRLASVRSAYIELFAAGRLFRVNRSLIHNRRAATQIEERKKISRRGSDAARKRWPRKLPTISTNGDGLALGSHARERERENRIDKGGVRVLAPFDDGYVEAKHFFALDGTRFFPSNPKQTAQWREAARVCGLADRDIDPQWDRFRDHHVARNTRYANWFTAWRNWARKEIDFRARNGHQRQRGARI